MSVAVDEIRDSIEAWREGQQGRLIYFIRLDAALTGMAAIVVFAVYALIATEPYLLVCGLACAAAAAIMLYAASAARRGDLSQAVARLAAANWFATLVGAALAPSVWPIFPLASLFPAIVAASYVRQDEFRGYLIASVAVATTTTKYWGILRL